MDGCDRSPAKIIVWSNVDVVVDLLRGETPHVEIIASLSSIHSQYFLMNICRLGSYILPSGRSSSKILMPPGEFTPQRHAPRSIPELIIRE